MAGSARYPHQRKGIAPPPPGTDSHVLQPLRMPNGAGRTTVQTLFAGSFSLLVRRRRAMTIAQHVGYAPSAALLRPDHHEFGDTFATSPGQLAETVLALFDRTVILDRIDPEGGGNQFAFHLTADVFAN